ncbi:MAG: paraslipin [Xylophilus ampelinus]
MEIAIVVLAAAILFITQSVKFVPQQSAWVRERLGKYHSTMLPGPNFLIPFIDKVAYRHSLKEIPLDVPSQVCITRDNTQLQVDGILYFQVTDPMRASYGSSNYLMAVTQLAQTSLRSVIGKLELDKTFEERELINAQVVAAIDEAALNWGVKVLRYEIKDLTPPHEILQAMQRQITAEREKRALIAASEGRRQEQINIATGEREAAIARSEGEKQAAINRAQGEAASITTVAEATAQAIARVASAIEQPGGAAAVQLKVAERAVDAYSQVAADANTTLIVPSSMAEVSTLIGSAMKMVQAGARPASPAAGRAPASGAAVAAPATPSRFPAAGDAAFGRAPD